MDENPGVVPMMACEDGLAALASRCRGKPDNFAVDPKDP
jgi:hypothetical protein